MTCIDCALVYRGKYYFFRKNYYVRYTQGVGVDEGYPKLIGEAWPINRPDSGHKKLAEVMEQEGWSSFDVAIQSAYSNKIYYFFRGNQYVKYEIGKGVPDSYPKRIDARHWFDIDRILPAPYDAAFYSPKKGGKYYFFKGSKYLRMTPGANEIDEGYPRSICRHWNGLWEQFPGRYSAACKSASSDDIYYFFTDQEYVRFKYEVGVDNAIGEGQWVYPRTQAYVWPGLWMLEDVSALTLGAFKSYTDKGTERIGPTFSLRMLQDEKLTLEGVTPGVTLHELKSITNPKLRGVTKWFQLRGMPGGAVENVSLKRTTEVVENFTIKNAPDTGVLSDFSFAMCSCNYDSRQAQATIPTLDSMREEVPDLIVYNGDTTYYVGEKGTFSSKNDVLKGDMKSQHQMFLRTFKTRHHPSVAATMRTRPAISTWDDHDFGFNNANVGPASGSNENFGMSPVLVKESQEVFRTCWPNDYEAPTGPIDHSLHYGAAEFFLPDCRSHRDPTRPSPIILDPEQCTQLIEGMEASQAKLKILVLSSQLISTRPSGESFFNDAGGADDDGQRMQLLNALATMTGRVLVLTGDVHFGELSWFGGTPRTPKVVEVTASPLLLRDPQEEPFPTPKTNDFRIWSAKGNNYAMLSVRFKPEPEITIQLRDSHLTTTNIHRPAGGQAIEADWPEASALWDEEGNLGPIQKP